VASSELDYQNIPKHVAIIMDGNGRWAKARGQDRVFGHLNGVESIRKTLEAAIELKVKYLTLYAFSTENWNRPPEEVEALMGLLVKTLLDEVDELHKNGVRLLAIGNLDKLPKNARELLENAFRKTEKNTTINLILALSYSSKWEITRAVQRIGRMIEEGSIRPEDISEDLLQGVMCIPNIPDPELLIRTSGEVRISNFLLWQLAYAELYFTETLWPDFDQQAFRDAIEAYQQRERRFGKISEQIDE
jgi:undecaprenyl diphosphate synthase